MKRIFTIAIVACLALGASAQTGPLGIKAGLNLSNISLYEGSEDLKNRVGFHLGLTYELPISPELSFQPEIVYSQQGAKNNFYDYVESVDVKETLKFDYINIPLVLKYHFADIFTIDFGAQVGFIIDATYEVKFSQGSNSETESSSVIDDMKTVDLSAVIGLTCNITNNSNISVRWNQGLTNTAKHSSEQTKNQVFQIGLGYRF